jgi:hypothetical protein
MLGVKLHRLLAGSDAPGQPALPVGEFLHPVPLSALVLLLVNDLVLKGGGLVPGAVTGKLSDVAGLLFFPLLCTSAVDLLLLVGARAGARVDFSLRTYKLLVATAITGALFTAIKLSASAADTVAGLLTGLGFSAQIVADPTDLLALPMLAAAYWLGRREIARVPLGRLEVIERAWRHQRTPVATMLTDVARPWPGRRDPNRAAAASALAEAMTDYLESGDEEAACEALKSIRAPTGPRPHHP